MSALISSSDPFLVRPAAAEDLDYLEGYLPGATGVTPPGTFLIAEASETRDRAGFAVLRVFIDGVGRFRLYVEPQYRRRGCGTALLEAVLLAAGRRGAGSLLTRRSWDASADDDETRVARAFCAARGLTVAQQICRYRSRVDASLAALESLYQRFEGRPSNPAVNVVGLREVRPETLARFAVSGVGGFEEEVAARLCGEGAPYCPATSQVALAGGAIVGALLAVTRGSEMVVETKVVAPAYRGGWLNLALMYFNGRAAQAHGLETVVFETDTHKQDTMMLARRFDATEVGRRQCFGCTLSPELKPASPR